MKGTHDHGHRHGDDPGTGKFGQVIRLDRKDDDPEA